MEDGAIWLRGIKEKKVDVKIKSKERKKNLLSLLFSCAFGGKGGVESLVCCWVKNLS